MKEPKKNVSLRLTDESRNSIQSVATRLQVRESDIYRLAINHLLSRFEKLLDNSCPGRQLLPLFLEFREELIHHINFKKNQLHLILNDKEPTPETYVSMADIELLLLPNHALRKRLSRIQPAPEDSVETNLWLKRYFNEKYFLDEV